MKYAVGDYRGKGDPPKRTLALHDSPEAAQEAAERISMELRRAFGYARPGDTTMAWYIGADLRRHNVLDGVQL